VVLSGGVIEFSISIHICQPMTVVKNEQDELISTKRVID